MRYNGWVAQGFGALKEIEKEEEVGERERELIFGVVERPEPYGNISPSSTPKEEEEDEEEKKKKRGRREKDKPSRAKATSGLLLLHDGSGMSGREIEMLIEFRIYKELSYYWTNSPLRTQLNSCMTQPMLLLRQSWQKFLRKKLRYF